MRLLKILLLAIVTVGCSNTIEDIVEQYDNGQIKTVRHYKGQISDDNLVKELQYYPDGKPAYTKTYKNSKPHGEWMFWHNNENIWSQGKYENGLRVGESIVYHENGKLFFKGQYIDGKKHGWWHFYDEEGRLNSQHEFNMGVKISTDEEKATSPNNTKTDE